jgi:hypothetical protein
MVQRNKILHGSDTAEYNFPESMIQRNKILQGSDTAEYNFPEFMILYSRKSFTELIIQQDIIQECPRFSRTELTKNKIRRNEILQDVI